MSRVRMGCCGLALGLVFGLSSVVSAQAPGVTPGAGALLVLDPKNWDFGEVWAGTPLEQTVTLTNAGDGPIEITRVRSSCGCTVADPAKKQLGPGERTTMTVRYDSNKYKKAVRQQISILTDSPRQASIPFTVSGTVRQVFSFEPGNQPSVQFTSLESDTADTQTLTIRNISGEPVELRSPRSIRQRYQTDLIETEPGMAWTLSVSTQPPLPSGSLADQVVLQTNHPTQRSVKISVAGHVRQDVHLSRQRVFVSPKLTFPSQQSIELTFRKENAVQITAIECADKRVSWEIGEARGGRSAQSLVRVPIRLTVPPGKDIPSEGIPVRLHTDSDDPRYQTLTTTILPLPSRPTRVTPAS